MYRLMISAREFSSDEPKEDMVALNWEQLLKETDQNKNAMRTQYTDLGQSGGLYRRKLIIKMKAQEKTGTETSSKADTPHGGATSKVPHHQVVWRLRAPFPTRFCLVIFHI
jgi:hypothetical protein